MYAAEAPPWVLDAKPDDQVADFFGYRWAAWRRWPGPLLLQQALVPGEQSAWRDEPVAAEGAGQEPGECGKQRPVRPVGLWGGHLSAQHGDLVAQDEYFGVLGRGDRQSRASHVKIRVASR